MSKFYAGVDLGARSSWFCLVDSTGQKQLSRKLPNDPGDIRRLLQPYLPNLSAVVESTFNWYWMVDFLQDLGANVKLAHPLYLKAIAYAKVKTDQVDAHTLAQLLRMDYIPEAFIYPRQLRPTRDMLRRRHRLVSLRARLYRDLQLQLMKHNVTTFSRNTIKLIDGRHLRSLFSHVHDRRGGIALLHLIDVLDSEIDLLDRQVRSSVYHHRPVVLLKTIPGVGRTIAPTIYYEIGHIHRFASDKAFASYCRLAPTIAQSGTITRHGKNRKQGNRLLKWAFSEAAQMAIQRYPPHPRVLQPAPQEEEKARPGQVHPGSQTRRRRLPRTQGGKTVRTGPCAALLIRRGAGTRCLTELTAPALDWARPATRRKLSHHAPAARLTGGSSTGDPSRNMSRPRVEPRTFWDGNSRSHGRPQPAAEPRWVFGAKPSHPLRATGMRKSKVFQRSLRDKSVPLTRRLQMGVRRLVRRLPALARGRLRVGARCKFLHLSAVDHERIRWICGPLLE